MKYSSENNQSRVHWHIDNYERVGDLVIPVDLNIMPGYNQGCGLKRNGKYLGRLKRLLWPIVKFRNFFLVDGFIDRAVGKLIRQFCNSDTVFLEVGCGSMELRKYLPPNVMYNAFDLEIADFHICRVLDNSDTCNISIASATDIPLKDDTVSLVAATETFEHIPEIDSAVKEIFRITVDGGILICTIPNNFCDKYMHKGQHEGHVNSWSFEEFVKFMESKKFRLRSGFMRGRWIPIPTFITNLSVQLPITSTKEFRNTNFFFVFEVVK